MNEGVRGEISHMGLLCQAAKPNFTNVIRSCMHQSQSRYEIDILSFNIARKPMSNHNEIQYHDDGGEDGHGLIKRQVRSSSVCDPF